jgi:hypothetical protein
VRLAARWRTAQAHGVEHCTLAIMDEGTAIDSVVIGADFAIRYRIACDTHWRTRAVDVALVGSAQSLHLIADGAGAWWLNGAPATTLAGSIDVDITATPFTNTLPIRRLSLDDGESRVITVAYVSAPELTVTIHPQRYTKLSARRYRFEALDSDFVQDLDVDEHGLVVHYPSLFERLE